MRRIHRIALAVLAAGIGGALPAAQAEIEINTASRAQLEQLRGVGIAMADRLLHEREQRPFSDWSDAMKRVPGLKARLASRLSQEGLRVQGNPYEVR